MTPMSDLPLATRDGASPNPPGLLARGGVARRVHRFAQRVQLLGLVLIAGLAACVLPPSLTVGAEDAAVNSAPAITSVRADGSELPFNGYVTFTVGSTPTMSVNLVDTDLENTLYVRAFVDYDVTNELDARSKCVAAPAAVNPTAERNTSCDLRSICVASDATSVPPYAPSGSLMGFHDLTVVAFDREPLDSGSPAFQAIPVGGLSTSVYFHLFCRASP